MDELTAIGVSLGHPNRRKILKELYNDSLTLTELHNSLNISIQNLQYHLGKMSKAKLILLDSDKKYSLTPIGEKAADIFLSYTQQKPEMLGFVFDVKSWTRLNTFVSLTTVRQRIKELKFFSLERMTEDEFVEFRLNNTIARANVVIRRTGEIEASAILPLRYISSKKTPNFANEELETYKELVFSLVESMILYVLVCVRKTIEDAEIEPIEKDWKITPG